MRALAALILALVAAVPAQARDVAASPPSDVSVTIYRNPGRNGGAIDLGSLGGFAVITEARTITLPAGESRLRFEGVVDGILPESAIISGLPGGVIEKNQDAALLSPGSLMRAVRGRTVQFKRTNPATGKIQYVPAEIIAADGDGVTFKAGGGVETLRCSGLPETFRYETGTQGLSARPTLSVRTRARRAITAQVTLTYIAEAFDWNASYTARINPDGKTLDLRGLITLANGNSVSLDNAQVQIVAGGLNREYVQRFVGNQPQVVARCWPMQRTHQVPLKSDRPYQLVNPWTEPGHDKYSGNWMDEDGSIVVTSQRRREPVMEMASPVSVMAAPPPPAPPEQLGDLKLYRVPQRTSVAAMQMKQTRMVEQKNVPFERVLKVQHYLSYYPWEGHSNPVAVLRTHNDKKHELGLPLPSGAFLVEQEQFGRPMIVGEPSLSDTAEDEKIELSLGLAHDVSVHRKAVIRTVGKQPVADEVVTITNAALTEVMLEVIFMANGTDRVSESSHPIVKEDGRQLVRLKLAPNSTTTLRYSAKHD